MIYLPTFLAVILTLAIVAIVILLVVSHRQNMKWWDRIREQQEILLMRVERIRAVPGEELLFPPRQTKNALGLKRVGGLRDATESDPQPRRA